MTEHDRPDPAKRRPLGERLDLVCPECGAKLVLKTSRFGLFYGCETWFTTKCTGSHGAHPDGSPMGTPADAATKQVRRSAHEAFDAIWQRKYMRRGEAYAWLAKQLNQDDPHIGAMTSSECDQVRAIALAYLSIHGESACQSHKSNTNRSRNTRGRRSRNTRLSGKPTT